MTKKRESRDDKLRRKLTKAQAALQVAQDKRRQATVRGEQEIEQARQRATRRLDKATQRVERRAVMVSRLENELLPSAPPNSPAATADTLQQIEAQQPASPLMPGDQPAVELENMIPPSSDTW